LCSHSDNHNDRTAAVAAAAAVEQQYYDVAIVGGGVVGSTMAVNLHRTMPALKVALLEAGSGPSDPVAADTNRIPNPRSYALSPSSLKTLGTGITSKLPLGYYDSMQVWQAHSPACLTFDRDDLKEKVEDSSEGIFLGACGEDAPMVAALWDELRQAPPDTVDLLTDVKVTGLQCGNASSLATLVHTDNNDPGTATKSIQASVLIGADGGNSFVRQQAGISRMGGMYGLSALTFTVTLSGSLQKRAFQRFLAPDGSPLALLPTFRHDHAVVVWSTSPEKVQTWKEAPEDDLVTYLNEQLQEGPQRIPSLLEGKVISSSGGGIFSNLIYGAERVVDTVQYGLAMAVQQEQDNIFRVPPLIQEIVSPMFTFPLSSFQATTYAKGRVALVGDAAHTVHPMAGQGLNLGLADVDVMVQCLQDKYRSGMDLSLSLEEYSASRQRSVSVSLGGIHALQRMFQHQHPLLQHGKTFGMNMIQTISPLRKKLAKAAAHGV
jgi:ubiquinone biosynthesis monooxygenase Coq6